MSTLQLQQWLDASDAATANGNVAKAASKVTKAK